MGISYGNFRDYEESKHASKLDRICYAKVDKTETTFFGRKTVKTLNIFRPCISELWRDEDSGEFVGVLTVGGLEAAYHARAAKCLTTAKPA